MVINAARENRVTKGNRRGSEPAHAVVEAAARNNAHWCDAICRANGAPGRFAEAAWTTVHQPPPFYGNFVSLTQHGVDAQMREIRELVDLQLGWSWGVKDSFRRLDLGPLGFETLFEATWIRWPEAAQAPVIPAGLSWTRASHPEEFEAWEAAWRSDPGHALSANSPAIFGSTLLQDPSLAFITIRASRRILAVCACNLSGEVAGLSNLVTFGPADRGQRAACIAACRSVFPGAKWVGYEPDAGVGSLLDLGFEAVAPLRVWLKRP
jgi:hypothetical protein